MSDEKVKVHVWYTDKTEETFYADGSYDSNDGVLYWNYEGMIISIPVEVIKKVEEK